MCCYLKSLFWPKKKKEIVITLRYTYHKGEWYHPGGKISLLRHPIHCWLHSTCSIQTCYYAMQRSPFWHCTNPRDCCACLLSAWMHLQHSPPAACFTRISDLCLVCLMCVCGGGAHAHVCEAVAFEHCSQRGKDIKDIIINVFSFLFSDLLNSKLKCWGPEK